MGPCLGRPLRGACWVANPQKMLITECCEPMTVRVAETEEQRPGFSLPWTSCQGCWKSHEAEPVWCPRPPPILGVLPGG